MKAIVAIYVDPDFYPPTISAILNLAERMEEVIVVSRNNSISDYPYPANVRLKKVGRYRRVRDSEKLPAWKKALYFLKFTVSFFSHAKSSGAGLILLYDPFALIILPRKAHPPREKDLVS